MVTTHEAAAGDALHVAVAEDHAFIRVIGRGTFKISPALKEFAVRAIDSGCRRIVLDMADCVGMDSTFMGILAGLALRLRKGGAGRVVMVNLKERTRGLLATLGLDEAIDLYVAGGMPVDMQSFFSAEGPVLTPLPTGERSQRETGQTMLEAHENLVKLSPENLPKFKDVLTFLREDLKKNAGRGEGAR